MNSQVQKRTKLGNLSTVQPNNLAGLYLITFLLSTSVKDAEAISVTEAVVRSGGCPNTAVRNKSCDAVYNTVIPSNNSSTC